MMRKFLVALLVAGSIVVGTGGPAQAVGAGPGEAVATCAVAAQGATAAACRPRGK